MPNLFANHKETQITAINGNSRAQSPKSQLRAFFTVSNNCHHAHEAHINRKIKEIIIHINGNINKHRNHFL